MLTLYIANKNYSSWSLRPWILLHELGMGFEEKLVPFGLSEDPRGFRAFSPSGKVPCLVDDATTVWDSLAIVEYLAETNPAAWPADSAARSWARSAAAEMHSGFGTLRGICSFNAGLRVRLHEWPPALLADWQRVDELWQDGLERFGGPFLAGKAFTAVDAFYAPVAFRAQTYSPRLSAAASAWCSFILERPALQSWYCDALAEPWRDESHDEEARRFGQVEQDLRGAVAA